MSILDLSFMENTKTEGEDLLNTKIGEGFSESSHEEYGTDRHDVSIPVPNTTTITTAQHDAALSALKKSFKEMADVVGLLENARIADSPEAQLEAFAEKTIDDLIYEACVNGPIYEAVDRSDKDTIKKIVRKLGSKVEDALVDAGVDYRKINVLSKLTHTNWWSTRLWQILGIAYIEPANTNEVITKLTEMFKDELGDYKILAYKPGGVTWIDAIMTKFGWKNQKGVTLLVIDKKLDWPKKAD